MMDYTNITAANCSTTTMPTLEELRQIADKLDRQRRETLRSESEMIEKTECPVCKRKPTVTGGAFGKTYVVCPHLWEQIKKHVPKADPPAIGNGGLPPLGWSPYGVNIEVMEGDR